MVNLKGARILIIEDDQLLGNSLQEFLELEGFIVEWAPSSNEVNFSRMANIDLVILDLMLPDVAGEELLLHIKQHAPAIPVIVLTAKSSMEAKKECFEKGVDDYVTKPFSPTELLLRIKAVLRRTSSNLAASPSASSKKKGTCKIGNVVVDLDKQAIYKNKEELILSKRAWDLLVLLLEKRGTVVTKEEILKKVWYDAVVSDESIRSYIKELRKILPEGSITTVRGRGYRLN